MKEIIYPAVFHANEDGTYTIVYPDLPGCISEGKTLGGALSMAQSALGEWGAYLLDKGEALPQASRLQDVPCEEGEFVNLIRADVRDGRAVRRTVSLPKWLDERAAEMGLSLSRVLQDALRERTGTKA